MSLNPDIRDQAYQFFIEEAQELLQVLEDGLLHLKDDHSTSKVHELMRAAHSIKGGAASVELEGIKLIAHRLEDFFKALYSEKVEFNAQLESLLLQAYDGLREPLTEQMEMGSFDEEKAIANVEPVFEELAAILGDALKEADSYIPSATDLGVDIVASIFEIDVQQSLDHLSEVVKNPERFDVTRELQEQLEVLGGFAELFTLPGFTEIINLSTSAIANLPQKALEITQIIINDCQQAREVILNGDRQRGGEPSASLIALASGSESPIPTQNSEILNELNSSGEGEFEEAIDSANNLENLFGGNFAEENVFDFSEDDNPSTSDNFEGIEDLFGSSFAALNPDEAVSHDATQELEATSDSESNIFDFAPQEGDEDSSFIFDWGDVPVEKIEEREQSLQEESEAEELFNFTEIEDVFGSSEAENRAFDNVRTDILEIGSKILNGETVDNFPTCEFEPTTKIDWETPIVEQTELETVLQRSQPDVTVSANTVDRIEFTSKENQETKKQPAESEFTPPANLDTAQSSQPIQNETTKQPAEIEFTPPENLDTALQSIGGIFEQLPLAKTNKLIKAQVTTSEKSRQKKAHKKKQAPVNNQLSVRVDLERLERMNNIIGELVINRNSLVLQNEQLQVSVKDITNKFTRFRTVTTKLRELSDRMLVESESSKNKNLSPEIADIAMVETDSSLQEADTFDALEMDSYNHLHLLLQGILEEIMQLEEGVDDIFLFAQQSNRTIHSQRQMLGQMRDELMWARMLPLEQILKRFPRTLRDLSNQYQKPVNLNLVGTGVLVDKAVLEKLYDPLLHLLRNGFDHGIEPPAIRLQQGKAETGEISIHAYYQGNQTIIEVRDDGKGLDVQKILEKAIKKDLISTTEAANITKEQVFDLIFEPGFSTAEKVSEISGRGVGMSVVREQIESLKGTISVNSVPRQGSIFTLALPLTLTIAKLLVVSLGETAFALPSDSIEEIIIPLPEQIKLSGNQRFLHWGDRLISIYNLQEILQYNCTIIPINNNSKVFESVTAPQDWALPLLLLRRGKQLFALEVACLITEQELVIKPFGKTLTPPNYTYGCTILGDGTLIPVLNGATLINEFLGETSTQKSIHPQNSFAPNIESESVSDVQPNVDNVASTPQEKPIIEKVTQNTQTIKQNTIMVVDDSTALRRTMALSLERQGYRIIQAKDGRDAISQLRKDSHVDLIVCDVEMPHMNGFEFLGVRRRDPEIKAIPVIMLTSRSGVKHRNLAKQLGANGYFTKPYVEQEFIKELDKILKEQNQVSDKKIVSQKASFGNRNDRKNNIQEKITVLIIDDSSALRRTMSLSLEKKGYRVLEARDGEDGIEQMYQYSKIDLVICDIEMPKMNGFEVLSSRRQDPELQKIPVAMLTSRNQEKHKNLAMQLGANAYFIKPYIENVFMVEIEKLIKNNSKKSFSR